MFDGHGSFLPASDHLTLHGLARCCFKAFFKDVPRELRPTLSTSLQDALSAAGLRRINVYNKK